MVMCMVGCLLIMTYVLINGSMELPIKDLMWMMIVGIVCAFISVISYLFFDERGNDYDEFGDI